MKILKYILLLLVLGYSAVISYLHFFKKKEVELKDTPNTTMLQKEEKISKIEPKKIKEEAKKVLKDDKNISKIPKKIPKDAIMIKLPEVPKVEAKVPTVITIGSTLSEAPKRHKHKRLSTAMPEPEIEKEKKVQKSSSDTNETKTLLDVGLDKFGRISTYIRGAYLDPKDVKERLKKCGFEVLSTISLDDEKDLVVVIFTDRELKSLAKISPYLSNMRVLIDKKSNQISISNPYYFAKAFMRGKFDKQKAKDILQRVTSSFEDVKDSKDKLKSTLIPKYQFMFGMPYYDDMSSVASGKYSSLLAKAKSKKAKVAFIEELGEDRAIVGIRLSKKTRSFINAVGTNNALLLPYPILIDKNEAMILDPKYYIAISYPMLKMSQFMKISDIPDAITAECEALFR